MSLPPPLTDLELLARARGLSNGVPPNEREVRLLASELSVCRNILDKLVEESSCSICYRPLRSMHVIECGHSFCTEVSCPDPWFRNTCKKGGKDGMDGESGRDLNLGLTGSERFSASATSSRRME